MDKTLAPFSDKPSAALKPHDTRIEPPRRSRRKHLTFTPYLYTLPALILVGGVILYGIAANVLYSTWDWNGISPTHVEVGLGNFQKIAADPVFWQALRNTALFGVICVFTQMILGFLLAILVRTRSRGSGLLRTMLFVPVVLSGVVVATSFTQLLTPDGAFNQILRAIGFGGFSHAWLADPRTALLTIAAINIWQFTGYSFVIYDAGLGQIDGSILEAARMDGASTLQLLRRVVFPLMNGSHLILIVLGFIGSLKTFELVFLTTGGGPGTSTEFLTTYIYRMAIPEFHAGYAAALSIALAFFAILLAAMQLLLTRRTREG